MVSDVPAADEAPLVTSGIYRYTGAQSFGGAHRCRVSVCVFIRVSVRACCEHLRCTVNFFKKNMHFLETIHLGTVLHGSHDLLAYET
jgi:hypothetical protein